MMWFVGPVYLCAASECHLGLESRRSGLVVEMGESLDLVEAWMRSLSGYTTRLVSSCKVTATPQRVPG